MINDSLKQHGCINTRANIISRIQPAILILLVMRQVTIPYGPFTYQGVMLNPVEGWTNHHSIVELNGKWYLFYHDVQLTGKTHLRNVKVTELKYNDDGSIQTLLHRNRFYS